MKWSEKSSSIKVQRSQGCRASTEESPKDKTAKSHKCKRPLQKCKSTTKCKKPHKHFSKISFNISSGKNQSKIGTVARQIEFASSGVANVKLALEVFKNRLERYRIDKLQNRGKLLI